MTYVFQFGIVFDRFPELLEGALLTIRLAAMALVLGLIVAVTCAYLRMSGPKPLRVLVGAYVEGIRNTPFLVQLYIIFFSLPGMGIRMDANQAALVGMVINFGAYATEIVRAGVQSVPAGQIEVGLALGLKRLQIYRFIVLFPAIKAVFPALASQFILLLLGSSVVSAISANELTAIANTLQSTTFRAFEVYIVVTLMYLAIAVAFRGLFAALYWCVFVRGRER
ncbi:MAG: amino acid ABC transporter permease [Alphaproteobacteria bacterium]|nr:MAG: amino acid ABC transporter permease [Alphaproteobacteria bacterium]